MNRRTLAIIFALGLSLPSSQDAHAIPTSLTPTPCPQPIASSPRDLVISLPSLFPKSELRISADGKVITHRELQPATPQSPARTRHAQVLLANQMILAGFSFDFNSVMKTDIVCATANLQPLIWVSLGDSLSREMVAASGRLSSTVPAPTAAQRSAFTTAQSSLLSSLGQQRSAVAKENGAARYGVLVFGSQKAPVFLVMDIKQGIMFGWNPTTGVIAKALFTDAKITHYYSNRPLEKARFLSIKTDLTELTAKALKVSSQAAFVELTSWVGKDIVK